MLKTIRYRDPETHRPQLGVLEGSHVYNVTKQVPSWTDPMTVWSVCTALNIPPQEALNRLRAKIPDGGSATAEAIESMESTEMIETMESIVQRGLLLPPVAAPEVWAAGVTYERSREARNAETKMAESVYDKVYVAERPEIFFKATADRIVAPGRPVGLRSDSNWMVPEGELALVISSQGHLIGWTLGNDLSSRDIEGENPLYLPQAKVFSRSCSIGPILLWNTGVEQPEEWTLTLDIFRAGNAAFSGSISIRQLRRSAEELISYLRRDNPVPDGTVLLTGTGIVPPDDFTLQEGDIIDISVDAIGTLRNVVAAPLRG